LPAVHDRPLGRFSRTELHRLVIERGISDASASTIWRWLHDDALKPWQQRSWIFVRDPHFAKKAGRVLELYQRRFQGRRLRPDEYGLCADEKSHYRRSGASMPRCRQRRADRAGSSSTTSAMARSPTWPAGTSTTPTSSTGSKRRLAGSPSTGSSIR
jgi:hypothetical protein